MEVILLERVGKLGHGHGRDMIRHRQHDECGGKDGQPEIDAMLP